MPVLNSQFQEGQLVTFNPSQKSIESFPYTTCLHDGGGQFALYESINLEGFPSWNDFLGSKILVERGVTCIVLSIVGYPGKCVQYVSKNSDVDLNVYNVLVRGKSVQVFGCDLVVPKL